jgi:hypothetical protein
MMKPVFLAIAAVAMLAGCHVGHLPEVAVRPPESYRYSSSAGGISVAVDPYLDEQRVKEYFGTDLLAEGILPVHLVIRNDSGSTYLFDPRAVSCAFSPEGLKRRTTRPRPDGFRGREKGTGGMRPSAISMFRRRSPG